MNNELLKLSQLLKEKCVIPFIGAGLSKACDLPSWSEMVSYLLHKFNIDSSSIDKNLDLLRICEYLKIINGGEIGPIRAEIEKLFNQHSVDISKSNPHIQLVSLGAPIIYTTNYDSLIEQAYEYLDCPFSKIVTTRDIIKSASCNSTQIVKFHGSFEHEKTMVLTESDYFKRLEFESPMDIKLRADMLGKSILFIGYSFADFNIRYLWYKLRRMMSNTDSPKSYILLSDNDMIMETLFKEIGIIPISLSDFTGNTTTERLINFFDNVIYLMHSSENWELNVPLYITDMQIDSMRYAIESGNSQVALSYSLLFGQSEFGRKQIEYITSNEWLVNDSNFGVWFTLLECASTEVKFNIIKALYKLEFKYGVGCLYDILITSFIRHPDSRIIDQENEWYIINSLINGQPINKKLEFLILLDSLYWITFAMDLRCDTTLYFIFVITTYFNGRMDEIILNPDYDAEYINISDFPSEYFNLSPQIVIDRMKKSAPWLNDIEKYFESIGDFEGVCGYLNCGIQLEEFDWNYMIDNSSILNKIFP